MSKFKTFLLFGTVAICPIYFYKKNTDVYNDLLEKIADKNGKNITELLKSEYISKLNDYDTIMNNYNILFDKIDKSNNFIFKKIDYYDSYRTESTCVINKESMLKIFNNSMLKKNWFTISLKNPSKFTYKCHKKLFMYNIVRKGYSSSISELSFDIEQN